MKLERSAKIYNFNAMFSSGSINYVATSTAAVLPWAGGRRLSCLPRRACGRLVLIVSLIFLTFVLLDDDNAVPEW